MCLSDLVQKGLPHRGMQVHIINILCFIGHVGGLSTKMSYLMGCCRGHSDALEASKSLRAKVAL